MWGRTMWALRGLFHVPTGLWDVLHDHDNDHNDAGAGPVLRVAGGSLRRRMRRRSDVRREPSSELRPGRLLAEPLRDDHHHDHAPLQHLLRHGHRSVPRPVFGAVRLWRWTSTQRILPAPHGAAGLRPLSGKLSIPTMPTRGM